MKVFYRTPDLKLHCYDVKLDKTETHVAAIQDVMKQLHGDMEHYLKPVLAVIKGGKQ